MLLLVGPYALLAILAIAARQLGWKAAGAAKALPLSFLIAFLAAAAATGRAEAGLVYWLIMGGLACGLAGDILLLDKGRCLAGMFPSFPNKSIPAWKAAVFLKWKDRKSVV